jgi:DNA-binding PadR family transcriptional regulator
VPLLEFWEFLKFFVRDLYAKLRIAEGSNGRWINCANLLVERGLLTAHPTVDINVNEYRITDKGREEFKVAWRENMRRKGKRYHRDTRRDIDKKAKTIPLEERIRRTSELLADDLVRARMTKLVVQNAFRNRLEEIHTGISPSSKTGDYTDVIVVTPYGEIPWLPRREGEQKLSRISDEEMKTNKYRRGEQALHLPDGITGRREILVVLRTPPRS